MNITRHENNMRNLQDLKLIHERQTTKESKFDTMTNLLDIEIDFETSIIKEELQRKTLKTQRY